MKFADLSARYRLAFWAGCVLAGFALTGCATMKPLSSTPPLPKIVLHAPFNTSAWLSRLILPAGEYRPLYEDGGCYYYQAPAKVVVGTLGSSLFDGGIYVKGGTTILRGWWYIDADGSLNQARFSAPPPYP